MSTPVIKRQNMIAGFKSRISVACGLPRQDSNTSAALRDLSAGRKSKIPVLKERVKNPRRQTLSSVTHSDVGQLILTRTGDQMFQTPDTTIFDSKRRYDSVEQNRSLNTDSQAPFLRESIRGMKKSMKSSLSSHKTVASTTIKPLLNENVRLETSTVVTRKLSTPTGQSPAMANSLVQACKYSSPTGRSTTVMANKSVMARKRPPPVMTCELSPPTGQSTPIGAENSLETLKLSPPTEQCASVLSNKAVVSRRISPSAGRSTRVMTGNSVETHKLSPPGVQSASFLANKVVVSRKVSPPTGQPVHTIANKFVVTRQSGPVTSNKLIVSHNSSSTSTHSTSKLPNKVVEHKANIPSPLAPDNSSRIQELKAAIRQTKAARYLKRMRPRNAPLPGAPQRAPKRTVLPGDYTRLKRTVGKSKLGECSTVRNLNVSTKTKVKVKRTQKLVLGPKGRVRTWEDVFSQAAKGGSAQHGSWHETKLETQKNEQPSTSQLAPITHTGILQLNLDSSNPNPVRELQWSLNGPAWEKRGQGKRRLMSKSFSVAPHEGLDPEAMAVRKLLNGKAVPSNPEKHAALASSSRALFPSSENNSQSERVQRVKSGQRTAQEEEANPDLVTP
ncbi:hypothetical protein EV426DRAFT_578980 [Tirmania nivea]|nr:hypothetical protein EV426DRAFT_578980 [Tirmania nivea]